MHGVDILRKEEESQNTVGVDVGGGGCHWN